MLIIYSITAGQQVNLVKEVKDLDTWKAVDTSLKFNTHINNIVDKASARACLINKCVVSRNVDVLLLAYKIYVRPLPLCFL